MMATHSSSVCTYHEGTGYRLMLTALRRIILISKTERFGYCTLGYIIIIELILGQNTQV